MHHTFFPSAKPNNAIESTLPPDYAHNNGLPDEIVTLISQYFTWPEAMQVRRVSRQFNQLFFNTAEQQYPALKYPSPSDHYSYFHQRKVITLNPQACQCQFHSYRMAGYTQPDLIDIASKHLVVSLSCDGKKIQFWDTRTSKCVKEFATKRTGKNEEPHQIIALPNKNVIAIFLRENSQNYFDTSFIITHWDYQKGACLNSFEIPTKDIFLIKNITNKWLAIAYPDRINFYTLADGVLDFPIEYKGYPVNRDPGHDRTLLVETATGELIVVFNRSDGYGAGDNYYAYIAYWDLAQQKCIRSFEISAHVYQILPLPNGRLLMPGHTGGKKGHFILYLVKPDNEIIALSNKFNSLHYLLAWRNEVIGLSNLSGKIYRIEQNGLTFLKNIDLWCLEEGVKLHRTNGQFVRQYDNQNRCEPIKVETLPALES